ncbi:MAG: class I SAM-dependent methyltransferase [Acidobacteriota bacterium]
MNESGYYHHRDFPEEHIRKVRAFYVPFFHDSERVLELGCGRGEFLEVLKARGKKVTGVELDPEMASQAREKGIEVAVAEGREYLASVVEPFDAIIAAHLLEHLPVPEADELIALAASKLCRGGILCLIVPNVASYPVMGEEFWNDPTHVRPYGHELLNYLSSKHGFKVLDRGVNPLDSGGYPVALDSVELGAGKSPIEHLAPPKLGHVRHLMGVFEGHRKVAEDQKAPPAVKELWQGLCYVVKGLGEEVRDAHQTMKTLSQQILFLNHQMAVLAGNLRKLVEILYAPNEYYLIAQKV